MNLASALQECTMAFLQRLACSRITLLMLFNLSLVAAVRAQEPSAPVPAHRPRIGLALSGGGALGLTEIGVIQWMEEHRIPVDRIAGTSMGSIIGAMYATGMSPAEIEKFAEQIDWDAAFRSKPTYSQ